MIPLGFLAASRYVRSGGGGGGPLSLSFQEYAEASSAVTHGFSIPLGQPGPDRIVVVMYSGTQSSVTLTSMTIDGIAATGLECSTGSYGRFGIAYATVPNGTTGTLAATFSGGTPLNIATWATNTPATVIDVQTDGPSSGTNRSLTLAAQDGGAVIAMRRARGGQLHLNGPIVWSPPSFAFETDPNEGLESGSAATTGTTVTVGYTATANRQGDGIGAITMKGI